MTNNCKIYFGILSNNRLETLKKTINSILTSNIENYEIIIYDNCSNNETKIFIHSLVIFKNIKVIFNCNKKIESNKSYGRNRIIDKVLELSKDNDYLRFIDDDDYFNSIGLNNEYKIIKNKNNDMIFVNRVIRENYNNFNKNKDVNTHLLFEGISNFYVSVHILKKFNFIRFDEVNHPSYKEDLIFFSILIKHIFINDNFLDNNVIRLYLDFSYYYIKTSRLTAKELSIYSYDELSIFQNRILTSLVSNLKSNNKILKNELYYLIIDYMKYTEFEKRIILDKSNITSKGDYYDFLHRFAIR